MVKEIKNKVLIVFVFFIIFSGATVGIYLLYKSNPSTLLLAYLILFAYMSCCTLYYMIQMIQEMKKIKEPFYNLSESKGDPHTLSIARSLEKNSNGLDYLVQSNYEGFRVIEALNETQKEKLDQGKPVYLSGITFFKTINPNKFTEIATEIEVQKINGKIIEKPYLIGGKKLFLSTRIEIQRDANGRILTHSTGFQNRDILREVLREVQEDDGWKPGFDAESKFGLTMGLIGGGGAILVLLAFIIQWISNLF